LGVACSIDGYFDLGATGNPERKKKKKEKRGNYK
jgi:hypothetical protein